MTNTNSHKPQLHYLVKEPSISSEKPPLLILLHGVGSNEENMFSFAKHLPGKYLIVSARGPLTFGPGSYAWFQVDFSTGKPVIIASQAEAARKMILQFIEDLKSEQNFDENQVFLMGFSQGGIMSYSVALTEPEKIKGIAVMSGRLLPEVKPLVALPERLKPLHIYISHGTRDQVLHYPFATDAVEYLKSLHLSPDFHTYTEMHTINEQMLQDVNQWLEKQ